MSVLTVKPKFLYPYSRQFPFDEVAEKIVKAIERRNWKVPGITVKFRTYGSGEAKYQYVDSITGDNFKLEFCRSQGLINDEYRIYNDISALHAAYIPKQGLEVFSDESGPQYFLYVGDNWEKDKHQFMGSSNNIAAKMYNKPRTYLCYEGNGGTFRGTELIATDNCGRDYSPKRNEPIRRNLEQTFNTFVSWLEEYVLNYILNFPESATIESPTKNEELIPYEGPWTNVFSICSWNAAETIQKGKVDPNVLSPEQRYAFTGNKFQLVDSFVESNGKFSEIAYKSFIWCDVNPNINQNSTTKDFLPDIRLSTSLHPEYIVSIKPKYANHIYVVDNAIYIETRENIFETIKPRERLSNEELGKALTARGATLTPISEYKGNYKEPIVLIDRELDFDEIDWVVPIRHT